MGNLNYLTPVTQPPHGTSPYSRPRPVERIENLRSCRLQVCWFTCRHPKFPQFCLWVKQRSYSVSHQNLESRIKYRRPQHCTFLFSLTCLAMPFSPPPCLRYYIRECWVHVLLGHHLHTSCCWWNSCRAFSATARAAGNITMNWWNGPNYTNPVTLVRSGQLYLAEQERTGWNWCHL